MERDVHAPRADMDWLADVACAEVEFRGARGPGAFCACELRGHWPWQGGRMDGWAVRRRLSGWEHVGCAVVRYLIAWSLVLVLALALVLRRKSNNHADREYRHLAEW